MKRNIGTSLVLIFAVLALIVPPAVAADATNQAVKILDTDNAWGGMTVFGCLAAAAAAALSLAFGFADTTALGPTPAVGAADYEAIVDRDYHTMPYTNATGSDISAGAIVEVGDKAYYCPNAIDNGKSGTLVVLTVADVVKVSGAIAQGADIYWDNDGNPYGRTSGAGAATTTASGNTKLGKALVAAGTTDGRVKVYLTGMSHTSAAVVAAIDDNTGGTTSGTEQLNAVGTVIDDNTGGTTSGTEQLVAVAEAIDNNTGGTTGGTEQLAAMVTTAGSAGFVAPIANNFTVLAAEMNQARTAIHNNFKVVSSVMNDMRSDIHNDLKVLSTQVNAIISALQTAGIMATA